MTALPALNPPPLDRARCLFEQSDYLSAERCARPVFEDATASLAQRSAAGLLVACCLYRLGQSQALLDHLPAALACADEQLDVRGAAELLRLGSFACSEQRLFGQAMRYADELSVRDCGWADLQITAAVTHAVCFERMGDPWQARRLLLPLVESAASLAMPAIQMRVQFCLARALIAFHRAVSDVGDQEVAAHTIEQACASAEQAARLAAGLSDAWLEVKVQATLVEACLCAGRIEQGAQVLAAAQARAHGASLVHGCWHLDCLASEVHLARQQLDAARDAVEASLSGLEAGQPEGQVLRVHRVAYQVYAARGDESRALAHLERCVVLERRCTAEQLQAQSRELVGRVEVENALRRVERATGEAREQRRRADALADVAMKDALTGVLNRRGLTERLASFRDSPNHLAVAMVDIDFFKQVNDTWGHAAGDSVLSEMGAILREQLRPRDVVARFGGEEFVLLLAGLSLEEAVEVCERLRSKVASTDWQVVAPGLSLTISVGLALSVTLPTGQTTTPTEVMALIQPADAALYRAKALGRNRVEVAH